MERSCRGHTGENGSRAVRRLTALQASGGRGLGPAWAVEEVRQDSFRQRFEGSVNDFLHGLWMPRKEEYRTAGGMGPHT